MRANSDGALRHHACWSLTLFAVAATLVVVVVHPDVASSANASRSPIFVSVAGGSNGGLFLNYDGARASVARSTRDWPIGLIFWQGASRSKIADVLTSPGPFRRSGSIKYEGYKGHPSEHARFSGDKGYKTNCDSKAADFHMRLYGPKQSNRFYDPGAYLYYMVASVHVDHYDGCEDAAGNQRAAWFGESERAEGFLASYYNARGYTTRQDHIPLANRESYRRDTSGEDQHIWSNDGRASIVKIP